MSIRTAAFAAFSPDTALAPHTIQRRALRPHDVLIEIAYSGICHSDLHTVREDWGSVSYPLVVGHEIAGNVVEVGSGVTTTRVGSRVGVGCFVDSCRECGNCLDGEEQHCLAGCTGTYGSIDRDQSITQGGYSRHIVVDENYVLRIPDALPLSAAAPLLCAGITTYSPLKRWKVGRGTRLAVVGLGGLGHMAVKWAHAFGADVTVLSRDPAKREDAIALGADRFFSTRDPETFDRLRNAFDIILSTVSANFDLDAYLALLRRNGTLVSVGAPPEPLAISPFSLIVNGRAVAGSGIGGIRETQRMLEYAAYNDIRPEIEIVGAAGINGAWQRLAESDVRYRFVIDASTFEEATAGKFQALGSPG